MPYGVGKHRPVIAYARASPSSNSILGSGGGILSSGNLVGRPSLGKYRNKFLIASVVTIFYTAFLYKSGVCICITNDRR
jgi:hypothetical protein